LNRNNLFWVGLGLIALHVLDDNFVQPQPGTSAADHLVSGLVPLVLLGLAAWAYPRARPGVQATLALVLGVAAVLGGTEALYYSGHGGLSGDDYTGLLSLVAALILLGLGLVTLWRSRRLDDRPARRYARRLVKVVAVAVVLLIAAIPLAVSYIGSHVARADVPLAELRAPYENVKLHTSDGLDLVGWYVPSINRAAVIVFPGRSGTRKQARMLARHGYGVLLYDRRGEGKSDGVPNGWGWDFDKDILAGVDFLKQRDDVDPKRIGGLGLSVGAEMMLETAASSHDLAAVVSEGAGARSAAEEIDDADGINKVGAALSYGIRDISNSILQNRLPPDNLKDLIPKIAPRPIFFIHAGEDEAGHRNPEYFRLAGEPKQIWEARGGHTDGIDVQPKEYERRVVRFFDGALR
jgi:hypothetical protein